jgi:uncharacterized membrane protein
MDQAPVSVKRNHRHREKWLLLGVFVGPFLVSTIYLLLWSMIRWKPNQLIDLTHPVLSIGFGIICAVAYWRPHGAQWFLIAIYALVCFPLFMVFSIALAITLGAPK